MKTSTIIAAAIAIFSCLLVLCAQGQPARSSNSCFCANNYVKLTKGFQPRKNSLRVHEPSGFCPQLEIILTRRGRKLCVDPKSPLGKFALIQLRRQQREAAAGSIVASSQTQTGSPASVHTTSQL